MIPFSVLDLSPIVTGGTAAQSLANTLDLAQPRVLDSFVEEGVEYLIEEVKVHG